MNTNNNTPTPRIASLDVLRGFDMFWLLGGDALIGALSLATGFGFLALLDEQLHHAPWHGFRFYDLIFPLFIFISGVSLGLQSAKTRALPTSAFYRKAVTRLLLLIALGVIYNHGWGRGIPSDWHAIRFASVLSRIAVAGFLAAMVVYHFRFSTQIKIGALVLILYSALQLAFPLDPAHSINAIIDQSFLPGVRWRNNPYDPEGLYGHIGAAMNALIGAWIGMQWSRCFASFRSTMSLLLMAFLFALSATLLHPFYPSNKSLWTATFVFATVAASITLLVLFHYLFDRVRRFFITHFVATFLRVIGVNALLAYLGTSIVSWSFTTQTVFAHWIALARPAWQPVLSIALMIAVQWCVLYWLDKHRAHLKV